MVMGDEEEVCHSYSASDKKLIERNDHCLHFAVETQIQMFHSESLCYT